VEKEIVFLENLDKEHTMGNNKEESELLLRTMAYKREPFTNKNEIKKENKTMPETVELNSYSLPIVNTPKLCTKETPSTKQNFKMSGDNTKSCDENISSSELEIDQSSQFAYQILADTPKENNILFSLKQKNLIQKSIHSKMKLTRNEK